MSKNKELHYIFNHKIKTGQSLRLITKVLDSNINPSYPMRVTVRFDDFSANWNIPYLKIGDSTLRTNEIQRTLCILNNQEEEVDIAIVISTANENDIKFSLQIKDIPNFTTKVNMHKSISSVTIGSPVFHHVDLSSIKEWIKCLRQKKKNRRATSAKCL